MKIAVINTGTLPIPAVKGGAVETLIENLIDVNEQKKNIDFTIFTCEDEEAVRISKGYAKTKFKFIKFNKDPFVVKLYHKVSCKILKKAYCNKTLYVKRVAKYLSEFDYIILENCLNYLFYLPKDIHKKCIIHLHNIYNGDINEKELADVSCVLTVSNFIKNKFVLKYPFMKDKTFTLYNGVKIEQFANNVDLNFKNNFYANNKIKKDDFVIIFVGRLVEHKGIEKIIDAMLLLPEKVKLIIVGNSWFSEYGENEFVHKLKMKSEIIKDRIIFTGYIPNQEIHNYYCCANVSCLPSLWGEPFGLTIVESLLSGIPVITTSMGGIPEITEESCVVMLDNDEFLVKRIAEKILYLYNNKDVLLEMSKKAYDSVMNFNDENFYKNFLDYLNKLN